MKWTKLQGGIITILIVISMSLLIVDHVNEVENHLANKLRIIVNPSYQAFVNDEELRTTLTYRLVDLDKIDEWSKDILMASQMITTTLHDYKMILPIFKMSKLDQFIVFDIPKTMVTEEFPYFLVTILSMQLLIGILINIKIYGNKNSVEDIIRGLENISRGKFEEVHATDDLCRAYNRTIHELRVLEEESSKQIIKDKLFLAAISHELKTPLATIMAHLEAFEHGVAKTTEKKGAYLIIIKTKFQQLSTQIEEFFKYAQNQSGHFKYNFQEVYFDDYMDHWLKGLEDQITFKNILPKCLVNLDKVRIEQVLENLYNNACKHRKTSIDIITYREDDYVVVEVKDDGDGIQPKDLPHIFDFYYQGEHAKEIDYEGIGMGLALCKQMIDVHRGKILVRSSAGIGTTFTIKIPVC